MDQPVELEVCANCKREIPHFNYVMHTAHCGRNITLCPGCKEPIPKPEFNEHKKTCGTKVKPQAKPAPPPTRIEQSQYFVGQKAIQDQKIQQRQEKRLQRLEKLVDPGHTLQNGKPKQSLLPCQYCELELPKEDLGEHENYCGARTEKCSECGELVMFKYRKLHLDSNHGFLKLNDEPGPKPSWDPPRRTSIPDSPTRRRPFSMLDMSTVYAFSPSYSPTGAPSLSTVSSTGEKLETSKELSRRLDCKTEYIRNLLHDSASITAPIRNTGAVRKHNKGPAPQPPRRNPPTELVIPCEFCNIPVPHTELIEHETGCRPDLARFNPRRRTSSPDFFMAPEPSSPDVELPCEFCADLIPASRLLSHQATCN